MSKRRSCKWFNCPTIHYSTRSEFCTEHRRELKTEIGFQAGWDVDPNLPFGWVNYRGIMQPSYDICFPDNPTVKCRRHHICVTFEEDLEAS